MLSKALARTAPIEFISLQISKCIIMELKELYIKTAKAYNNLDPAGLESVLAADVTYDSQGSSIKGKEKVIEDLNVKFQDLKQSGRKLYAELAILNPKLSVQEEEFKPCLILSQEVQVNRMALILVTMKDGLIDRIEIRTDSPNWREARGSGLFPA